MDERLQLTLSQYALIGGFYGFLGGTVLLLAGAFIYGRRKELLGKRLMYGGLAVGAVCLAITGTGLYQGYRLVLRLTDETHPLNQRTEASRKRDGKQVNVKELEFTDSGVSPLSRGKYLYRAQVRNHADVPVVYAMFDLEIFDCPEGDIPQNRYSAACDFVKLEKASIRQEIPAQSALPFSLNFYLYEKESDGARNYRKPYVPVKGQIRARESVSFARSEGLYNKIGEFMTPEERVLSTEMFNRLGELLNPEKIKLADVRLEQVKKPKYQYKYDFSITVTNNSPRTLDKLDIDLGIFDCPSEAYSADCDFISRQTVYLKPDLQTGQTATLEKDLWLNELQLVQRQFVWKYHILQARSAPLP